MPQLTVSRWERPRNLNGSAIVARITRQSAAALALKPGLHAYAVVKAVSVSGPAQEPR